MERVHGEREELSPYIVMYIWRVCIHRDKYIHIYIYGERCIYTCVNGLLRLDIWREYMERPYMYMWRDHIHIYVERPYIYIWRDHIYMYGERCIYTCVNGPLRLDIWRQYMERANGESISRGTTNSMSHLNMKRNHELNESSRYMERVH